MWEPENIDNDSTLLSRIHKDFISSKDNLPKSSAFSNTPINGDNLSSDWTKYCTPESSRELIGKQKKANGELKNPSLFFMWLFNVGKLRTEMKPNQTVEHEPIFNNPEDEYIPNNRAHSIIIGEKPNNAEFRVGLLKIGNWAIGPEIVK